jgi:membrane peptidoglycan carboxypeptidase
MLRKFLSWIGSSTSNVTGSTFAKTASRFTTTLRKSFTVLATQVFQVMQGKGRGVFFSPPVPILEVRDPEAKGSKAKVKCYELLSPLISLGNSSNQDITVRNARVSRLHCSIAKKLQADEMYIRDNNSTNGTYCKRRWWQRPQKLDNQEIVLKHGDLFFLGNPHDPNTVKIRFVAPPALPVQILNFFRTSLISFFSALIIAILAFLTWTVLNWSQIPGEVLPLETFQGSPIIVYATDRTTLLEPPPKGERVVNLKISDFPEFLRQAVIVSEDRNFYQFYNLGVDPTSIVRAFYYNIIRKESKEGGSTLTQQLARTLFSDWVGREYSWQRKLKEATVALKINFLHDKDEILRAYLSTVFLGRANNGFQAAAHDYFGKSVQDLNLNEAVTLVALLPAPNGFDLCHRRDETSYDLNDLTDFRNRVLEQMQKSGFIQNMPRYNLNNAFDPSICTVNIEQNPIIPNIYSSLIYRELYELLPEAEVNLGNLILETTLDVNSQKAAKQSLEAMVKGFGGEKALSQGALVSLDARTGGIRALIAAVEPQAGPYFYDYATVEQLKPGSTFKVFAYTAALQNGVSPNKVYDCQTLHWQGEDFFPDGGCEATLDIPNAVAKSNNLIAIKVAKDAGIENVKEMADRMGIKDLGPAIPRMVLGQYPVKLIEMTGAYGVLANQGKSNHPHSINRIIDLSNPKCDYKNYANNPDCQVFYSYQGDSAAGLRPNVDYNRKVVEPDVAQTMTNLLRGVVQRGTARNVRIQRAVGKTGTSDESQDLWFIGYIPNDLVTGIWLGNPASERRQTSGYGSDAAQVWNNYMESLGYPVEY